MTNLNEITYVDWQCKINEIGSIAEGIDDINQCISIILQTPKGSDPHRPDFGSDILTYVDYPINIAKANIVRETIDAVTKWETRINITKTEVEVNFEEIFIRIEWTLKDSDIKGTAEIKL